jgi:hypothetical protein
LTMINVPTKYAESENVKKVESASATGGDL